MLVPCAALASAVANLRLVGEEFGGELVSEVTELARGLASSIATLEGAIAKAPESPIAEAEHYRDAVLPAMAKVRSYTDQLEGVVADDCWPLPTYQEMLFSK